MANLQSMPQIHIDTTQILAFGKAWYNDGGNLSRTPPFSSGDLGKVFDTAVGDALATMLGNTTVKLTATNTLLPSCNDCVEVGPVRVIGGVRPQNFDVGYRPDGIRIAFDSKTLNDTKSVGKNWQNMVNDLATEATTVHSRFPYAVVAFIVVIPLPCILTPSSTLTPTGKSIIETLERLARRGGIEGPPYMAEAISLALWNPDNGEVDPTFPDPSSTIRIENFSNQVGTAYINRYKGLPPHAVSSD